MDAADSNRRSFLKQMGFAIPAAYLLPAVACADETAKQLAKLDAEFLKQFGELAKKYDKDQVPEAAHFFASCAIGFGTKDETLTPIKGGNEGAVYLGRLRGGEPLKDTAPITGALGNVSSGYKKILDPWIKSARKGELPEATRKLMLETGVKYELARGAHEYVQAIQRLNALRKGIPLRAILWDFDASRKVIIAAWYSCETGDTDFNELKKNSPFYASDVSTGNGAAGGPMRLREFPEVMRSFALARQDLLNPNARQLWLGYWGEKSELEFSGLYEIPQLPYLKEIPTPTQKYRGETVVQDWVDVEETLKVGGSRIPYVKYPYSGEADAPRVFSNGKGFSESGWAKSEHNFRDHAGVPIMIRFFIDATPMDVQASLSDKSGTKQACRLYLNGDKRAELGAWATILLLPERPLIGQTEYAVCVKCKISDTPFEKTWTFKTRSD